MPRDRISHLGDVAALLALRGAHGLSQRLWRAVGGPGASDAQHAALDIVVSRLRARNLLHPHAFYPGGFGDSSALSVVARGIRWTQHALLRDSAAHLHAASVDAIAPALVSADARCPDADGIARVHEGGFVSPPQGVVFAGSAVPAACLAARFQLVTPLSWASDEAARRAGPGLDDVLRARPVVVLLAGTGEQGFARRRQLVSMPLARAGVASVILESPYYGSRRPPHQVASKLRTMTDLPLLGRMTIEEARSIVGWLRRRRGVSLAAAPAGLGGGPGLVADNDNDSGGGGLGDAGTRGRGGGGDFGDAHGAIVLAGVSMGGLHAAMTASMLPPSWRNVGLASWLGPPSGAAVFTRGRLAFATDFAALARDVEDRVSSRSLEASLEDVESLLYMRPGSVVPASAVLSSGTASVPRSAMPTGADVAALAAFFSDVRPAALELAQRQAVRLLRLTDITNFAPPARPDASIFVMATGDQYVPRHADTLELWQHVREQWSGAEVREVRGGHVTASLFELDSYLRTLLEALRRVVQ